MKMTKRFMMAMASMGLTVGWGGFAGAADALKLEKGDHVVYVGNTLPDRMQHFGWLETMVYSRFPDQDLVFRDLAVSGDEINHRERCEGFGSPDEWLTREKADVIFAFFGFNESFGGAKGLDRFKAEYDKWVKETLAKKYGEKGAPRLVLFSPIAVENLKDPNLPDGVALNKQIKPYADAIAEVAKANNVTYVDLFTPTQELYAKAAKPLTINGIHMNEEGDRQLAAAIDQALFNAPAPARDTAALEKIRQAVNDKNFQFFERYRTLDGYNVYGGRSHMKYAQELLPGKPQITNLEVMQREMQVLDVMTENRDKRVQAVAQGKDLVVDDSNTPPFIPVGTNFPGLTPDKKQLLHPDGTHDYLSGAEGLKHMKLAKGMKANLFADEKMFPELVAPVQMAWDTKGRLWVACWNSYPRWRPKDEMKDKIIILEDTDGDGVADKCTTFLDKLNCPTGFEFYNGGIMLAQAPAIWFAKDTDGDGKADQITRVLEGFDSADTHHTSNSFTFDPGGALYWQEGTFMHSQIETLDGPIRANSGAVWRFEPKTFKFDHYTSYGFANPHGHVFDYWGTDIVIDGTGAEPHYGPAFSGKLYGLDKRKGNDPRVYDRHPRPCPGAEILSSKAFPDDMQGNFLVPNVIGFQGILNFKLTEKGSGLVGTPAESIISSDDPNFRPSDVEIGPDGAIYFTDWHNAIIGHLQHHLRDPNRDHAHGRVYRITYEGRELDKAPPIAGQKVEQLLDLLKSTENRVRYRTKIELSAHDAKEVIPAVEKWIAALDKDDANYSHNLTEGLWMYSWNHVVNEPLLKQVLASPDYHARAAAVRVLCYWMDSVPDALDLLKTAAIDKQPRVRLEAIRACSFSKDPKALETAQESLAEPDDVYIKYTLSETERTLEGLNKTAKPQPAKTK